MEQLIGEMKGKSHFVGFFGKDKIEDEEKLEVLLKDYFGNRRVETIKKSILDILDKKQEISSIFIQVPPSTKMKQLYYEGNDLKIKDYSITEYTNPIRDYLAEQPEFSKSDGIVDELLCQITELISRKKFDVSESAKAEKKSELEPKWTPKGFKYKGGDLESGYIISDDEDNEFIYCPILDKYVSRFFISKYSSSMYGISKPNLDPWTYVSFDEISKKLIKASKLLPYDCELFSVEEFKLWKQWINDGKVVDYSSTNDAKNIMITKITGIEESRNFSFPEKEECLSTWTTGIKNDQHTAINIKCEMSNYLSKYSGDNIGFRVLLARKLS